VSNKTTCPGCDAHTSGVTAALEEDRPCPHCGLSSAAIVELMAVRETVASEKLKGQVAGLVIRADKAESERDRLRDAMSEIRTILEDLDR
jgi:hypothetical protein